jgi:flagellar assembly protein FliH
MAKIIKSVDVAESTFSTFQRDVLEEYVFRGPAGDPEGSEMYPTDPAQISGEVRRQVEEQLKEAYQEGLKRGVEAGREAFTESVGQSADALARTAEAMQQAREAFLAALEPQVVRLACAIAERVIRREIHTDPSLVVRMAKACLLELVDRENVTVRLNPGDYEALQKEDVSLLEEFDGVKQLQVVADETVEPGGCLVDTDAVQVDGQLSAQFERVLENLME